MTKKDEIVDRLLKEGHITSKEAILLLKEKEVIQQFPSFPFGTPNSNGKVPYHEICGCDVCNCINANKMVDPIPYRGGTWIQDNLTSNNFTKECRNKMCFCDGSCK